LTVYKLGQYADVAFGSTYHRHVDQKTEGSNRIYALCFTHSVWWCLILTETSRKKITLSCVLCNKLCTVVGQYCRTAYWFELNL